MAKRKQYEYLYVTDDKYELPILSADNPRDMAKLLGILPDTVRSKICMYKKRPNTGKKQGKIIKVELEEDDL